MVGIDSLFLAFAYSGTIAAASSIPSDTNNQYHFGLDSATGSSFSDKTVFAKGILTGIGCTGHKRLDMIKVAFTDCDGNVMHGSPYAHMPSDFWGPDARLERRVWLGLPPDALYTFKKGEGIVEVGARLCRGKDSKGEICQLRMVTNMGKHFLCGSAQNTDVETVWKSASGSEDVLRHLSGFTKLGKKPGFTRLHTYAGPAVCKKK